MPVIRLFPLPGKEYALEGLYLSHALHKSGTSEHPCVYGNFISSLDGRIGIPKPGSTTHQVPPAIANRRDWRLFQELAAQADVLITTARYFRQLASGDAQDFLPIGKEHDYDDLRTWRAEQGLTPQPAIAILSGSMDIPIKELERYSDRSVHIITGEDAPQNRVNSFEEAGISVLRAGSGRNAQGNEIITRLAEQDYKSIYAIAGPRVMHTLISAGALQSLYLTVAHRILGGTDFDTFTFGDGLEPAANFTLQEMYYDQHGNDNTGQCYSVYRQTSS